MKYRIPATSHSVLLFRCGIGVNAKLLYTCYTFCDVTVSISEVICIICVYEPHVTGSPGCIKLSQLFLLFKNKISSLTLTGEFPFRPLAPPFPPFRLP